MALPALPAQSDAQGPRGGTDCLEQNAVKSMPSFALSSAAVAGRHAIFTRGHTREQIHERI